MYQNEDTLLPDKTNALRNTHHSLFIKIYRFLKLSRQKTMVAADEQTKEILNLWQALR